MQEHAQTRSTEMLNRVGYDELEVQRQRIRWMKQSSPFVQQQFWIYVEGIYLLEKQCTSHHLIGISL